MAINSFSPGVKLFLSILLALLGVLTIIGSFVLVFWNETQGLHNAIASRPTFSESQLFVVLLRVISLVTMVVGAILLLRSAQALTRVIPIFKLFLSYGRGNAGFISGLVLWTIATSIVWIEIKPLWVIGLVIIVIGTLYLIFSAGKYSKKERLPKQDKL